jgi:hypothetical protein
MVSGILERRYQACQQDLSFERGFLHEHADESEVAMQALLDRYRDSFFAAFRASKLAEGVPAKAAELTSRLKEIMDELNDDKTEDPDGVPLNLLIGCFVPAEQPRPGAGRPGMAR